MKNLIPTILISALVSACVSANYALPVADYKPQKVFTINTNYDNAYSKLVTVLASTFFAIDNFEKESGLITLSYTATSGVSKYIDCGRWKYRDDNIRYYFDGKYEDYLVQRHNAKLVGRLNIVMKSEKNKTSLIVNSRYTFDDFTFDGVSESIVRMTNSATKDPTRACKPTGYVEKLIAEKIEAL